MAVYAPMTTILKRTGYDVISLKRELAWAAERMARALAEGIGATRDPGRDGFYDVEMDGIRYYVHVNDKGKTAYVVALFRQKDEQVCCPELVGAARAS